LKPLRKRVLITGGTGFLGKHLALAMKDSHEVVLSGRNNKQSIPTWNRKPISNQYSSPTNSSSKPPRRTPVSASEDGRASIAR
jgi:nucleoside-diphosphate-sugar epimerase